MIDVDKLPDHVFDTSEYIVAPNSRCSTRVLEMRVEVLTGLLKTVYTSLDALYPEDVFSYLELTDFARKLEEAIPELVATTLNKTNKGEIEYGRL